MNESSVFAISLLGLIAMCVAEHLLKPARFGTATWVVKALRVMIIVSALVILATVPRFEGRGDCQIDPESIDTLSDCL